MGVPWANGEGRTPRWRGGLGATGRRAIFAVRVMILKFIPDRFAWLGEAAQMLYWLYWLYWFYFEIAEGCGDFWGSRAASRPGSMARVKSKGCVANRA